MKEVSLGRAGLEYLLEDAIGTTLLAFTIPHPLHLHSQIQQVLEEDKVECSTPSLGRRRAVSGAVVVYGVPP